MRHIYFRHSQTRLTAASANADTFTGTSAMRGQQPGGGQTTNNAERLFIIDRILPPVCPQKEDAAASHRSGRAPPFGRHKQTFLLFQPSYIPPIQKAAAPRSGAAAFVMCNLAFRAPRAVYWPPCCFMWARRQSMVSSLTTCSIRQASWAAMVSSTPREVSTLVSRRCRS